MYSLSSQINRAFAPFFHLFPHKRNYTSFLPLTMRRKETHLAISKIFFYKGNIKTRDREVVMDFPFTKASIQNAASLACDYVEAESSIDRAFITSLFADTGFDGFEVVEQGNNTAFGLYFSQTINPIVRSSLRSSLPMLGSSIGNLRMKTHSSFLFTSRDLSKEEIERDPLLIYFSHSKKFRQFSQHDHLLKFFKIVDKF